MKNSTLLENLKHDHQDERGEINDDSKRPDESAKQKKVEGRWGGGDYVGWYVEERGEKGRKGEERGGKGRKGEERKGKGLFETFDGL